MYLVRDRDGIYGEFFRRTSARNLAFLDPHGLIIEFIRTVVLFVSSLLVIVTMIAMLFLVPPTSNPAILISISILVVFSGGAFHRAINRSTLLNAANRLRREALENEAKSLPEITGEKLAEFLDKSPNE